jgi:tetratricopeptide (TPR) repeat protein
VEEARALAQAAGEHLRELGYGEITHPQRGDIERLSGDNEAAAERFRVGYEYAAEHGVTALLSSLAPMRGRVLCALGRFDEAEPLAMQGQELGADDDALTQTLWRQVAALVKMNRGEHAEAERLAREAVTLLANTDALLWQGDAFYDLAQVLAAANRDDEATDAYRDALALYERKGIIPLARSARERLAALQAPTA